MFEKSYNRAVVRLRIETVTPLLIRAGDAGLDPTAAELSCVRTRHAKRGSTVYIPGSSLKGVLRSAAEAAVRGRRFAAKAGDPPTIHGACDPLSQDASCAGSVNRERRSRGRGQEPSSAEVHRLHCLACRLFGSLAMKGRASVRDLFPWDERGSEEGASDENARRANTLERRHGVSINRMSGSVDNGPWEQEMVPAGVAFWGEIALENYQAWQLGFLAQAFDEVNEGFAQLGSTKSRGLGVATIEILSILHEQKASSAGKPAGVGQLASNTEVAAYGLLPERALPACDPKPHGLAQRFAVMGAESTGAWAKAGLDALEALR